MRSRDADVLIIPGLGGSGPDHWQSRWQARLPNAHRVEQSDWDNPDRAAWIAGIRSAVGQCRRPIVAVAHSLGVVALAHAAAEGSLPIAGAFMVTPPSEATIGGIDAIDAAFAPVPARRLGFPAVLVASRTDPYSTFAEVSALAEAWGATLVDAGQAGHINADSGHGPWPEGLMTFGGFLNKL